MMATSLTVAPQHEMSAGDKKLYRLWRALPADRAVGEEEAFALLEEAAGRPGDNAWASAMLTSMAILSIVTESRGLYTRAPEFPALLPDHANRYGQELYNEELKRKHAETRRKNETKDAEADKQYQDSPEMRERRERREEMREVVHEEIDAGRLTIAEAQLRQALVRIEALEQKQLAGNHIAA